MYISNRITHNTFKILYVAYVTFYFFIHLFKKKNDTF